MPTLDRRGFIRAAGTGLAGLAAFPQTMLSARGSSSTRPPNIVYIMADDLGLLHLGCYGGDKIATPKIDRLAAGGMRFTRAYAGATVCAPSRACLMTGLHGGHAPVRANNGGTPLRPEDITIPEMLRQAGYVSGGYGKWGLGEAFTTGLPTRQGFDDFLGYYHQVHAHFYYPEYLWKNEHRWPLPGNRDGGRLPGDAGGARTQYAPDEILEHALNFIRSNRDRPFFCYYSTIIPHVELAVPEQELAPYLAENWPDKPFHDPRPGYQGSAHPRATLAAMITRMDKNVGRIMDLLKELDLDDNTVVFFTSDNGAQGSYGGEGSDFFEFFEPMGDLRGRKGSMYEGGLRVPMIVRWPGRIPAGAVNSDLAWYFPDVMPTLAELAGAQTPAGVDGISVLPSLIGEKAAGRKQQTREYLYWELWIQDGVMKQAALMGEWKALIEKPGSPIELYNLASDESESNNVASENPRILERMKQIFEEAHTEPMPQVAPPLVRGSRYF